MGSGGKHVARKTEHGEPRIIFPYLIKYDLRIIQNAGVQNTTYCTLLYSLLAAIIVI